MNIDKLIKSRFLRPGALAAKIWPHLGAKSALDRLILKANGTQGRSFNEEEKERIKKIWEEFKKEIDS